MTEPARAGPRDRGPRKKTSTYRIYILTFLTSMLYELHSGLFDIVRLELRPSVRRGAKPRRTAPWWRKSSRGTAGTSLSQPGGTANVFHRIDFLPLSHCPADVDGAPGKSSDAVLPA